MRMRTMMSVLAVLAIGLVGWAGYEVSKESPGRAVGILTLGGAMGMAAPAVRDAALKILRALPAGAATVISAAIDTGNGVVGDSVIAGDFELVAPALTVARLADATTVTYNICWSANANLSAPVTYIAGAIVQLGAGGVGAVGSTYKFRLPSTADQFIFFTAVKTGAADASGVSATLDLLM